MPAKDWTDARRATRKRQKAKLEAALATVEGDRKGCWVVTCPNPAGRAVKGSLGRFCERHGEAYRRHGSPLRPSYKAAETNPNRRAALAWLKANRTDVWVQAAIEKTRRRYDMAGRGIEAFSLRGHSTSDKAHAVWARLRAAEVDPLLVVASIVGVTLTFEQDRQRPSGAWGVEYRRVQIAKVLNRMAGGVVKRWAREPVMIDDGVSRLAVPPPTELKAFQSSSGRVLRSLGTQAEAACELLVASKLDAISAHAATMPMTKASLKSPWPDRHRAKPKPRIPKEAVPTGPFAFRRDAERRKRREKARLKKEAELAAAANAEGSAARQPQVFDLVDGRLVKRAEPS